MGAMTQIRIWQAVFAIGVIAGLSIATSVDGAEVIGVVVAVVSLLLFFGLVAVIGWAKAGRAGGQR